MAKITLAVEPTFEAEAKIPVPGVGFVAFKMTYKWRHKDEIEPFLKEIAEYKDDVKAVMKVASGWELDDEFTEENVKKLTQKYGLAPRAIYEAYLDQLIPARLKN